MSRTITISAGERTRIFRRRFSSLPQTVQFDAVPAGGKVERIGWRWILGRNRSATPLESRNVVTKGYWDTFFEIYVTPEHDTVVTIARPRLARRLLIGTLAIAVIAAAAVAAIRFG
jgi:hypothetical protein